MLSYCLGQHDIRDLTTQRYKTFDKLEQCHISFTIITLEHASVIPTRKLCYSKDDRAMRAI